MQTFCDRTDSKANNKTSFLKPQNTSQYFSRLFQQSYFHFEVCLKVFILDIFLYSGEGFVSPILVVFQQLFGMFDPHAVMTPTHAAVRGGWRRALVWGPWWDFFFVFGFVGVVGVRGRTGRTGVHRSRRVCWSSGQWCTLGCSPQRKAAQLM